jgi:hypothetical protein
MFIAGISKLVAIMTRLLILFIFSTFLLSCNAQTEKRENKLSIYHLDSKTRKEMTDSLVKMYKQYGDTEAQKHADAFVNKYEALQIEQQDSIKYMSDIYVEFKHSQTKTTEQKPVETKKNEPK